MRAGTIIAALVLWPVGCHVLAGLGDYGPGQGSGGGGSTGLGGDGGTAAGSGSSAWLGSYARRRALVLDTTVAETDLMGFTTPVVIPADEALAELAQGDGRDIAFTSSDGETPLSHEIEHFDTTTGSLVAWVHLPVVQAVETTTIYLYFGDPEVADQQDLAGTWPQRIYRGVWHLSGDPRGAPPQMEDSSSYGQGGVVSGVPTSEEGIAAAGLQFGDSTSRVTVADADHLDLTSTGFSFSLWVKAPASATASDRPMQKIGGDPSRGYIMSLGSGVWGAELRDGTTTLPIALGQEADHVDAWTQLAVVADPSTGFVVGYVDGGVSSSQPITSFDLAQAVNNEALYISGPGGPFSGMVDELRIHGVALTEAWIALDHHALTSPTYIDIGELEQ